MPKLTDDGVPPHRLSYRSFISVAAAFVKVMTRIPDGFTLHSSVKYLIRWVMVNVLPEPGPASTSMGPLS